MNDVANCQVFAKGAKFSMFKPAEEMVYIGLDEESRTKGKAAIDVVGAQSGKSAGSVLQQVATDSHGMQGAHVAKRFVQHVLTIVPDSWSPASNCTCCICLVMLCSRSDRQNMNSSQQHTNGSFCTVAAYKK